MVAGIGIVNIRQRHIKYECNAISKKIRVRVVIDQLLEFKNIQLLFRITEYYSFLVLINKTENRMNLRSCTLIRWQIASFKNQE